MFRRSCMELTGNVLCDCSISFQSLRQLGSKLNYSYPAIILMFHLWGWLGLYRIQMRWFL